MNTALEYSTRVVQEGGRRCKKSTLNDLVHLTPLRIPLMNQPYGCMATGRPLSKVLPFPNKGSRSCFIDVPQLRDISQLNIFNVHRPDTIHVQTVFSLYTASLRPSISPWKFVLICVVLSYLSVNTVHHTLLHTVVYGTHSGWCRQERSKVARELKHKVFCLVWSVLKEVLVKKWFPLLFFLVRNVHMLFGFNFCFTYMYIHNCVHIIFKIWYKQASCLIFYSVLTTWCRVSFKRKCCRGTRITLKTEVSSQEMKKTLH